MVVARGRRVLLGDESIDACVFRVLAFALLAAGLDCADLLVPLDAVLVLAACASVSVVSDMSCFRCAGDGDGEDAGFGFKTGKSGLLLLLPPRPRTGVTASASVTC